MENTIWCLFSIENNYDQPKNNLVCAWIEKPAIKEFANTFGIPDLQKMTIYDAVEKFGEQLQKITKIYNGEKVRISNTDYRFEEIKAGQILNQHD